MIAWGDHLTLRALSKVLDIRIHVMTRGADESHDSWTGNMVKETDIVILFTPEQHYDATAPRVPWFFPPCAYAQGVGRFGYESQVPILSKRVEHALLARGAEEHLPRVRTVAGELWPRCWDSGSPAFAVNLARARAGFPGGGALHRGATAALANFRARAQSTDVGVEKAAMGPLFPAHDPTRIELLVVKRLSALFPEFAGTFESTHSGMLRSLL